MDRYNTLAKCFHWIIGVLIIGLIAFGIYMEGLDYSDQKMTFYGIHKSLGAIVLGLMLVRIVWRIISAYPSHNPNHKLWERILSKIVHGVLYLFALSMPLSGWAMSSSYGYPVSVFGWFSLPALVEKNEVRGELFAKTHELGGYAMIAIIAFHVAGALKHHVIDKDNTLKRMLPFAK